MAQRIENGPEKTKPIKISFDEWGPWDETKGTPANGLEQHYDLTDCLAMASWFNVFIRNADIIAMANNAQLVNAIAPVRDDLDIFSQRSFIPNDTLPDTHRAKPVTQANHLLPLLSLLKPYAWNSRFALLLA
ncbi:hypothetical protein FS837_011414 [Tulasnella sp. UAMH 9824]|nr:hypothetical protein FS837_011414 [Tulasnella sp. UAMH 9824]